MSDVVKAIGELNRMCGQLRVSARSTHKINGEEMCILNPDGIHATAEVIEWCADVLLHALIDEDE